MIASGAENRDLLKVSVLASACLKQIAQLAPPQEHGVRVAIAHFFDATSSCLTASPAGLAD
jgi:hypothetical protein